MPEEQSLQLTSLIQQIKAKLQEDNADDKEMQRTPLKKVNDNVKTRGLIRLANDAIANIIIEMQDVISNLTAINKLIYAVACTVH